MSRRRQQAPRMPVVSVGNLAMGGRGKTPVVACLARLLVEAGERPAILSRGYKRKTRDTRVVVVSDGVDRHADLDRSGDEPLMLARAVPGAAVLVHPRRAEAAAVAEGDLGVTVHLLDDGFQHAALARDVDIVLVTPEDLDDRRVPLGRLREPVTALGRADAVIVDGGDADAAQARVHAAAGTDRLPVFALRRRLAEPVWIDSREAAPPMPGQSVVALAGIARPARFTEALTAAGWRVAATVAFGDHHRYTPPDLARLAREVARTGAGAVLTTDKDAVRLRPFRPLPVPVAAVPLEADVEPADRFRRWLFDRLAEARA